MGQEPDAFEKVEGFHDVDGELPLFTPAGNCKRNSSSNALAVTGIGGFDI